MSLLEFGHSRIIQLKRWCTNQASCLFILFWNPWCCYPIPQILLLRYRFVPVIVLNRLVLHFESALLPVTTLVLFCVTPRHYACLIAQYFFFHTVRFVIHSPFINCFLFLWFSRLEHGWRWRVLLGLRFFHLFYS